MFRFLKTTFIFSPIGFILLAIIFYLIGYIKEINLLIFCSGFICIIGLTKSRSGLEFLVLIIVTGILIYRVNSFHNIEKFVSENQDVHSLSGFIKEKDSNKIELFYTHLDGKNILGKVVLDFSNVETDLGMQPLSYIKIKFSGKIKIFRKENLSVEINSIVDLKAINHPLSNIVQYMTNSIYKYSLYYFGDNSGLVQAMVFGVKEGVEKDEEKLFRNLGLSHILVASGANIIMVLGAIKLVISKLRIKHTSLIEFFAALIYTLIVGVEGSITRAFFFFTINMISSLLGREIDYIQKIFMSIIFIGILFPYLITGLSFILSLVAALSIKFASDVMDYFRIRNKIIINLITNIFVLFIVNIIISSRFHVFNVTGLVSNILVLFLVEWIVIYGFGFILISIFLGLISVDMLLQTINIFAIPINFMLNTLISITKKIDDVLGYSLNFKIYLNTSMVFILYFVILIIWTFLKYKQWIIYKASLQKTNMI